MKARILPLNSEAHRAAQELLPWFVNGTLSDLEAARVRDHVTECSACQADAATQAQLREVPLDAAPSGDIDRGWRALRSRLDVRLPMAGAASSRWWPQRSVQLVVALQAAAIVVLTLALITVWPRAEPYRALGTLPVAEANALAVFRTDATQAQMSAALRAAGARIVGGPTVTDAYLLRIPDVTPEALRRLRAQPGVASVESLQGEPVR